MRCPGCGDEARKVVAKTEHIYPKLIPGVPAFWWFMSPAVARSVAAAIAVVCVALILIAGMWLSRGLVSMGLAAGLVAIMSLYICVACVRALGRHRIKVHFRCTGCGLEWSPPGEPRA